MPHNGSVGQRGCRNTQPNRIHNSVVLILVCSLCLPAVNMPSVSPLCRHTAVLVESIKKGIRDADSEARVEARK